MRTGIIVAAIGLLTLSGTAAYFAPNTMRFWQRSDGLTRDFPQHLSADSRAKKEEAARK
jgi:hypothetical protein